MNERAHLVVNLATGSAAETQALAERLGRATDSGCVFALTGPLGVGKTCFAQGLLAGLGVEEPVQSPTFILIREYEGRMRVMHMDAYRLEDPGEWRELGLDEELARGTVLVVEWADRVRTMLPEERIEVFLRYQGERGAGARSIRIEAYGSRQAQWLRAVLAGRTESSQVVAGAGDGPDVEEAGVEE